MILKQFKRHAFFGAFTLIGFVVLFIVGLFVSFSVEEFSRTQSEYLKDANTFIWWRATAYTLLIVFWPRLIRRAAYMLGVTRKASESRKALIFLILFYEVLIVQNPLSVVLDKVL